MGVAKLAIVGQAAVIHAFDDSGKEMNFQVELIGDEAHIDIHVSDEKSEKVVKAMRDLIEALRMES